jgi:hypothetical protein
MVYSTSFCHSDTRVHGIQARDTFVTNDFIYIYIYIYIHTRTQDAKKCIHIFRDVICVYFSKLNYGGNV